MFKQADVRLVLDQHSLSENSLKHCQTLSGS